MSYKEQRRHDMARNEAMTQVETELQVTQSILPTTGQTRCPCVQATSGCIGSRVRAHAAIARRTASL